MRRDNYVWSGLIKFWKVWKKELFQSVFPFSLPKLNLDKIFSSSSASGGELISDKHVVEGGIPMRVINSLTKLIIWTTTDLGDS